MAESTGPRFCGRCGAALGEGEAAAHQCREGAAFAAPAPVAADPREAASVPLQARPHPAKAGPRRPAAVPGARWSGRPREVPSIGAWVAGAYVRRGPAVLTGIVAAWFNLPVVIFMGAVGAVLGGIAGLFSGTAFGEGVVMRLDVWTSWILPLPVGVGDLVPTVAWQIGGVIGAIWGAASGAVQLGWLAFWWPWSTLFGGDPAWPVLLVVGQTFSALLLGTVYTLWAIAWEPWRLRKIGARRLSRREAAVLMPWVEEAAAAMGLRALPRVLITDSPEPNAHAATRHIVIHRGLIVHLQGDKAAIQGVIAHELAHWASGDPVGTLVVKGVALPLYLVFGLGQRLEQAPSRAMKLLVWLLSPIFWSVAVCVRYVVAPVEAATARRRELRADAAAAAAGFGPGLHAALESFAASFDGALDGWDEVVLRGHPHTEDRLDRLEVDGVDYPWGPGLTAPAPSPAPRLASALDEEGG
jgi:Zn-dependent protease with chaperone function